MHVRMQCEISIQQERIWQLFFSIMGRGVQCCTKEYVNPDGPQNWQEKLQESISGHSLQE